MEIREEDRLLTPAEVALLFRVDAKTVARYALAGKLGRVVVTPGGHRRFYETDIRALLAGRGGNT